MKYPATIKLRVTPEQEASYKAAAGVGQMSGWLRMVADDAIAAANDDVVNYSELRREIMDLRTDLRRGIGNNINQIAKKANQTDGISNAGIDAVRGAMAQAVEMIEATLKRLDRR